MMARKSSAKDKISRKKYLQSAAGKASAKRYKQSAKGKACVKKYKQSDKGKKKEKRYRDRNRQRIRDAENNRNRELKKLVINHYGGKCKCCGEIEIMFLTIDHINNDGAEHRRKIGNTRKLCSPTFYRWLRNNNFPKDFQVLCWNCNCGKMINKGTCPHKTKKTNNIP